MKIEQMLYVITACGIAFVNFNIAFLFVGVQILIHLVEIKSVMEKKNED